MSEKSKMHNLHKYVGLSPCIKDTTDYMSINRHLDNCSSQCRLDKYFHPNNSIWDDYEDYSNDLVSYYHNIIDGKANY